MVDSASFERIADAGAWMKRHHLKMFCVALRSSQQMGYDRPARVVPDAKNHGVEIRLVCVNASHWDCTLEPGPGRYLTVRLGL